MTQLPFDRADRRTFVLGSGALTAYAAFLATPAMAQDAASIDEMIKKFVGDAKPVAGKITLDLPEIAENGNTVPYSISVDSPMTDADNVKAVHVIAAGNPQPDIASFEFTPQGGKAVVASRMRLGRTQDIYALAQMSDGKVFMAKKTVKVTIGGCGG